MKIDLISSLVGFHICGFLIVFILMMSFVNRKMIKCIPLMILISIFWEIGLPIIIYLSFKKAKNIPKLSIEAKIKKENDWYENRKITIDDITESTLKNFGIKSPKEKWLIELENGHNKRLADLIYKKSQIEEK